MGAPRAPITTWSSDVSSPDLLDAIWPRFRTLVPQIPSCKFDDDGKPLGRPRKISKKDVELIAAYRSASGAKLVGARVRQKMVDDCNDLSGFGSDLWFYLSSEKKVRELPGIEMEGWATSLLPVDFGDFDGDGKEEAVFWYSGYNADGYVLFYDEFKRDVRFIWGYH